MVAWHIVSLASILVELLLFLKVRRAREGLVTCRTKRKFAKVSASLVLNFAL